MSDELKRYMCVVGEYPDDFGYETETIEDEDGEFYMVDDVKEYLASQISNNTKETHLRVKELEEALRKCATSPFNHIDWKEMLRIANNK